MSGTEVDGRPLRADAERNRRRILAAAATVFAERGLDVSLDDIAAAAGVGVGTVYRRFPDKDALIDALFADKIGDVERLAHECLGMTDPGEAFASFLRGVCRLNAEDRGLKEVLLFRGLDRARRARETIAPLAGRLLERAQAAGAVRADLAPTDIPLMHFAVGFVADRTREVAPDYWERTVTILLDGLAVRRDGVTPLDAPPLGLEQVGEALVRRG